LFDCGIVFKHVCVPMKLFMFNIDQPVRHGPFRCVSFCTKVI